MTSPALPLIHLSRLDADGATRAAFLAELRAAARDVGFFYLSGHGIPDAQVRAVTAAPRAFFELPEAEKTAIAMVNSPHFRGYTRAGGEITRGRPDWREQIDIGVERPALPRVPGAPAWTRLPSPNQWPASLPDFRPTALGWLDATMAVLRRLLGAFALALGQPATAFDVTVAANSHSQSRPCVAHHALIIPLDPPAATISSSDGSSGRKRWRVPRVRFSTRPSAKSTSSASSSSTRSRIPVQPGMNVTARLTAPR